MSLSLAALIVAAAVIVASIWLDRKIERSEPMRDRPLEGAPADSLPAEGQAYLRQIDSSLELPASDRADIRAELADHVTDSIAAIKAEGMDEEHATHEALARLGSADEMARQLRRAHQSTRRALAGAAGGVFEAGVGVVWGTTLGFLLGFLGYVAVGILVSAVLRGPIDLVAARLPRFETDSYRLAFNSAFYAGVLAFACWMAARRGVRTTHLLSRRSIRVSSLLWAAVGGGALTWIVLFVYVAQQTWLTVAVELTIPIAFAFGALFRVDRPIRVRFQKPLSVLVVLAVVVLPVLLLAVTSWSGESSSSYAVDMTAQMQAWDRVAPAWGNWETSGPPVSSNSGDHADIGVINETYEIGDPAALASLHDLRFELWRAVRYPAAPQEDDHDLIPDPAYPAPYAAAPAVVSDGYLVAHFDVSRVKTDRFLLFVIGTGPDGHRYRLTWPDPYFTTFSGTVWDWLTAGS
jgi:hypothetical protein